MTTKATKGDGFAKIRKEHVSEACRELLRTGTIRGGGSYFVVFEKTELPAKRVLREAYRLANSHEVLAREFSGGIFTQRVLEGLGFSVVVRGARNEAKG